MVGNSAEAEDLTEETFLLLLRKIHTFCGESAFSTWLHRLAVNVVLMSLHENSPQMFASCGLTLRGVAIAAAVIRNGGTMPTAGALIEVTAECGSPTARNGQQHFDVLPADPLAVSLDEGSSDAADDIGHLEWWPAHLRLLR
jgi:Sigma-70 region 2